LKFLYLHVCGINVPQEVKLIYIKNLYYNVEQFRRVYVESNIMIFYNLIPTKLYFHEQFSVFWCTCGNAIHNLILTSFIFCE